MLNFQQTDSKKTITIIGCGATGVSLFIEMVNQIIKSKVQDKLRIVIIDKNSLAVGGVAYHTTYECNLLNIPAGGMSLISSKPDHFYDWILHNQNKIIEEYGPISISENEYFPRKLFGRYIYESFNESIKLAKKVGLEVHLIQDEVININRGVRYEVFQKKGNQFFTDYLSLCLGGFENNKISEIPSKDTYLSTPYNKQLQSIPKTSDVIVLGTRLSAIDTILMLKSQSHTGRIICVSRNGQLPRVQGLYDNNKTPAILNEKIIERLIRRSNGQLKLNHLLGLIRCEAELQENIIIDCNKIFNCNRHQRALLKHEIQLSTQVRPWQSILYKMNKLVNKAWVRLSPEDQDTVYNKYLTHFVTYRSAMPLKTAKKIYTYLTRKEVFVVKQKTPIYLDANKKQFLFETSNNEERICADYLINATGISHDINLSNHSLIKNLLRKNIICPHRFGGCNVDPQTLNSIDESGHVNSTLFVIGALTQGVHISTSLLEHLVECAQNVAMRIVADMGVNKNAAA